jgi:hypothetical protein
VRLNADVIDTRAAAPARPPAGALGAWSCRVVPKAAYELVKE